MNVRPDPCRLLVLFGTLAMVLTAGCHSGGAKPAALRFWHTRTLAQEQELKAIVAEFNRTSGGPPIVPEYAGDYPDVRTKALAAIASHRLPLLAVCYENQVQGYAKADAVAPLDEYINDPKDGLSKADLDDIYPQFLASNRFPAFGNKMLSFPFTKSVLVQAFNQGLLRKAGFRSPPQTWDELRTQARAVRPLTGHAPLPFVLDPSTIDGIILSHGGELISADGKTTYFDQPPTVKALTLLRDLKREKLLDETQARSIPGLFGGGDVAFLLGTSSGRSNLEQQVKNRFPWDITMIPHAPGIAPVTVLYGANVCVFRNTPENERLAWRFIKFFTSRDVTARWSIKTGYLPVRKSAADLPEMKEFFRRNPPALHSFEILPSARVEPNAPNWEEVRTALTDAVSSVLHDRGTPEQIAKDLKSRADAALSGGGS